MSAVLLFCTSKVPASTINRLMQECALPDGAFNFFSLVRTPDQETLDEWNTEPLIHDFDTGFEGKRDTELREFFQARLDKHTDSQTTSISDSWIAVLDDESRSQNTVVLHYSYERSSWGPNPIPGPAEVSGDTIWWKWRVPFRSAWTFWNTISSVGEDAIEIYSRPEYISSDGVLQTETPEKIIDGEIEDPKA
ncbi:uncharacterized protein BDW43DRAFT_199717 [Aspergillus alliaceus]|uniref:uncharacterized protein n=1 Tax=Petromyces alliaceus TaxID=209559 RepID=UPI0012A5A91B|nr:uncharacterized protein BDW43DRAFT_199717 [Aspergillus alliaceus]KAB8228978.1 hypothetical protein BDW43DRAFT_199717 [Aspergillus alliaceus]